jgi:EAL domain-containing protein (putative c-di-GMP-specific phosphodiesterase class I)
VLHSADDAARIARKVLDSVRSPIHLSEREFYTTTSIGIALYPDDGTDAESLLKNADTAMYQAKEHGRDNYQIFNAAINAKAVERLSLEHGLRKAITNREFILYYQPIYNLHDGTIRGMEALVRWQHPELGLLLPGSFIPAAESTGLMIPIGAWVLETACAQARAWHEQGHTQLIVSVNLSVGQLQQSDLVSQVRTVLEQTGLRADHLELEITESGAMHKPESSIQALQQLRQLGVRIALDDFGIGHSSLSHLKRFPIDTLKIDQSFIRDITDDPDTAAIVTGIIAMGHTLRLAVVAEGVEVETQRGFLKQNDCDLMQGFLSQRPVPPGEFERLLKKK